MNAHVTITTMNAEAIRARLDEIGRLERAHAGRNLDVELAEVMRLGGDVDALEEKHLQAERVARRLRVERQALEAELPAAIRRSGAEQMAQLVADHERDTVAMRKTIPELVEDWKVFIASLTAFGELQGSAFARAERSLAIQRDTGATIPEIGNFKSQQVEDICAYLRDHNVLGILASIGTSAANGKSTVID